MLESLRIKNFKPWIDTKDIRLAPITVFFGENSSGKSSIMQFLLMLKQTVESPDRKRILHPGDKNTVVELGTYKDMVFTHDTKREIEFKFEWKLPKEISLKDVISGKIFTGTSISFKGNIGLKDERQGNLIIKNMSFQLEKDEMYTIEVGMKYSPDKDVYEFTSDKFEAKRPIGRSIIIPSPIKFYGFPDEVIAYYTNVEFVKDFTLALETLFNKLNYLGPLRTFSERLYTWTGEEPGNVGWQGERTIEAILAGKSRNRKIVTSLRSRALPFEVVIARWLEKMHLIKSFKVEPIKEGRRQYEVLVKTFGLEKEVNLADVGFGVSQVLPVLVQCFYAQNDSTIIIEQPEIHLHPSVQSSLADMFIEVVKSRESGSYRNIQLLIESHSEHFLRRLQRRIAEEKIESKDVAIYFTKSGENGSKIEELCVDIFGNITNWPDKFFGDPIEDLAEMTNATIERKKEMK